MTEIEKRRQEIVEGVAARIADAHGFDWAELADDSIHRAFYLQLAEELVIYEDSQGVVLQVERELPEDEKDEFRRKFIGLYENLTPDTFELEYEEAYNMIKQAGCAFVEPLIKEDK